MSKINEQFYNVGQRVEKWCAICGEVRGHVVASVSVLGRVSRVTCPTCGTRSSFKASLHSPAPHRMAGPFERYDQAQTYRARQTIMHPSYGPGEVIAVIAPGKIDVLFADRVRRLAHSRV